MKNASIGKYIPGNSVIHRMDPRIKLAINIIFIVLVFLAKSFISQAILITPIIIAFLLSGVRKRQILTLLKPALIIGIFLFVINVVIGETLKETFDSQKNHANWLDIPFKFEWTWKTLTINYPVIKITLIIMIRIYVMILITTLLMATTKQMALTKAIEDLLWPLKLIKIHVNIIAMIISIALRFIPTLLEEAQRIMKAQSSRGVDFKNGGIKTKSKSMITLIIPLFVSAFSKAEDLGNAMETRGYNPYEKRTRYRSYRLGWIDLVSSIIIIGLITYIALIRADVFSLPIWWTY